MARIKGSKKTGGGSRKGKPNKATQDIKDILNNVVDFNIVVGKLYELTNGITVMEHDSKGNPNIYDKQPDSAAAKILLEYGFGKPKQTMDLKVEEFTPPQIILDGTATNKTE